MKVWEAHKVLADAVGDYCDIDANNIYDGVRYSKEERNLYLYQALLRVFSKQVMPILALPRKQMISLLNRFYPNMIKRTSKGILLSDNYQIYSLGFDSADGYINPAVILEMHVQAYADNEISYRGTPIPYKTTDQVAELINSRNAFKPDLFYTYTWFKESLLYPTIYVHDYQKELKDIANEYGNIVLSINMLNYPKNPKDQENNEDLYIETMYLDKVFQTAIILMMRDDQEIEGVERVMPLIEPFMQQGGQ